MESEFKQYIGKTIKIYTKNKFKYNGKVLKVSGPFIIIEDKVQGEKGIAISEILDFNVIPDEEVD